MITPPEFANQGNDNIPFSLGILVGDTLYVSGEIGFDLRSGEIPQDFGAEVKACLDNIGIILKSAGMDYADVVSVQVFLTDMTQFKRMNAVYASVFKTPRPARLMRNWLLIAGDFVSLSKSTQYWKKAQMKSTLLHRDEDEPTRPSPHLNVVGFHVADVDQPPSTEKGREVGQFVVPLPNRRAANRVGGFFRDERGN